MPIPTLLALTLAAAGPNDGSVSLVLGSPGLPADVVVLDETGAGSPLPVAGLQGIALEPIDFTGRTRLETFLDDRPRRFTDVPGGARLRLPAGAGSLYAFARPEPGGGTTHGYFLVEVDGGARHLLERPGLGPGGDATPFLPFVSVAPDGSAVLVGTLLAAGGDALEIDLATGGVVDRTAAVAPLDLAPAGLRLGSTWGAVATQTGVLRFDRVVGALAQTVPLPGGVTWVGGEWAPSGDGSKLAFAAGSGPQSARVHVLAALGTVEAIPGSTLQPLSPVGHLPTSLDGPYLGFSGDGSICTWRTEGVKRESWIARVAPPAPGPAPVQLTADALFVDTLDEVGLVGSVLVAAGELIVAVGERADPLLGGVENLDFYRVSPAPGPGDPTIVNLSLSSGNNTPPFTPSSLDTEDGVYRVPGSDALLLHDSNGGTGELVWLDLAAGAATTLLDNVKSLDEIESVGADFLLSVRREGSTDHRQLVRVRTTPAPTANVMLSLPKEVVLDRFAPRADGWCGVAVTALTSTWMTRVHVPTGALELLTTIPAQVGPAVTFSPGGRLVLPIGVPGGVPLYLGWGLGVPWALYPLTPQPGFVLPGA